MAPPSDAGTVKFRVEKLFFEGCIVRQNGMIFEKMNESGENFSRRRSPTKHVPVDPGNLNNSWWRPKTWINQACVYFV
jgi:hypothetical protein